MKELIPPCSSLPVRPLLAGFGSMLIQVKVDIYNTLRFEPMNYLSLGISKKLKDFPLCLLKDESRFIGAM